jgi:hypothetical protein
MAYVSLDLSSADPVVAAFIRMSIEPYLREAHFLLAAATPEEGPANHFPIACAVILLATVGATSALDNHERTGKKRREDKWHFLNCLDKYFPWDCITIEDGEFRSNKDRRNAAAIALYEVFRCPLVHSGGLVDNLSRARRENTSGAREHCYCRDANRGVGASALPRRTTAHQSGIQKMYSIR